MGVRHCAAIGLLAVVLSPTGAWGQGQRPNAAPPAASPGFATISGIVEDSIHGGALVGASVTVDGTLRQGLSDSLGRFRIDSIEPGRRRVGVFHPLLDSLSMGIESLPLTMAAGDSLSVVLATPSPETIAGQLCRGSPAYADGQTGPAVLAGRVLDANSDQPVAGAQVVVTWFHVEFSSAGLHRVRAVRQVETGPTGEFHICQIPPRLRVLIRATKATGASGAAPGGVESVEREYDMGDRFVGIVALHVPLPATIASSMGVGETAALSGRVTYADGKPAAAATVGVVGSDASSVTDDKGQFVLRGVRPGTRTVIARTLGYEPVTALAEVGLGGGGGAEVRLAFGMKIAVLDSIKVVGQLKAGYASVGFDRRRQTGVGFYMTAEDVARKQPTMFHDIFVAVPGVHVVFGRGGQPIIAATRAAGGCVSYVIDGAPYSEGVPGDIDDYIRPEEVGAIESYESTEAPAEYRSTNRSAVGIGGFGCAVIVIWTKTRLGL